MGRAEVVRLALVVDHRRWDNRRLSRGAYLRRRAYAVVLVCLCLACCPVWPEPSCTFVGTFVERAGWEAQLAGQEVMGYVYHPTRWWVEWQMYGEQYRVASYDRDSMRVLDAILWERSR